MSGSLTDNKLEDYLSDEDVLVIDESDDSDVEMGDAEMDEIDTESLCGDLSESESENRPVTE